MCREKQPLIYYKHIHILGLFLVKLYFKFCHNPIILTSIMFLISNFCCALNVVCFLLGNCLPSEFYMATFQNTPCLPSSQTPMKMEQTECSETLTYKIQTPGNYPEQSIQQTCSCTLHAQSCTMRLVLTDGKLAQLDLRYIYA